MKTSYAHEKMGKRFCLPSFIENLMKEWRNMDMRNIVSQILNAREVRADVVTTNSINGVSSEEHARVKGVKYPIQGQIDSLWKKKTI